MWLRKEQGNCSIGPYTWAADGDVVWVDDPVVADELVQARNDITEATDPALDRSHDSTEGSGPPFSFDPPPDLVVPAVEVDPDEVPDTTAAKVLEWVGSDVERAVRALQFERSRGAEARGTLVVKLQKLAGE